MDHFEGKVAIVTGAASGIGKEISRALVARGATVVLADIHAENVAAAADELGRDKTEPRVVDVTDAQAVADAVRDVVDRHGRLDFMFNNAGIAVFGNARDMTLDDWNRLVDINIRGVIHGVAAAYPLMTRQGFGHIVNTASAAGLAPTPGGTGYSMTKHAVVGLSTSLRVEASRYGVRVSAVCPGFIETPILQNAKLIDIDKEEAMRQLPFRFHSAVDLARAVLRGVERNQGIVVFTPFARFGWYFYRLSPALAQRLQVRLVRNNPLLPK
jgi:NAD(P)-dependent dehydrogenase (short-subunit alcohol dehydrogenase family)